MQLFLEAQKLHRQTNYSIDLAAAAKQVANEMRGKLVMALDQLNTERQMHHEIKEAVLRADHLHPLVGELMDGLGGRCAQVPCSVMRWLMTCSHTL